MRKSLFRSLALALLLYGPVLAEDVNVWVGLGWRQDNLSWNIAGPHGHPNVLSELKWKNIDMIDINAGVSGMFFEDWYYKFTGDYAKVYNGSNEDSDYLGDHRTNLFAQSKNDAKKGEAIDLSFGLGYPLHYWCNELVIIPLIGYALNEQHLTMQNGFQTVDTFHGHVGPIPDLHSNYRARWMNAWIGLDFGYQATCEFLIYGSAEYHFASYRGSGHWNLRNDFVGPFKHNGNDANGFLVALNAEYDICYGFAAGVFANYRMMQLNGGTDKTHFLEPQFDQNGNYIGDIELTGTSKLNSVKWHSYRIGMNASYEF